MIDPEKARAAFGTGRTWHVDDGDFPGLLARIEQDAIRIDLNDPATENLVADAIRRLAPEGAYVPLSVRYPWRFTDFARTGQQTTLVDAVVEALRGSAEVHDAERIPHLVAPLLALAEAIERGGLIPGPPPGPCPAFSPEVIETRGEEGLGVGFRYPCELRATHAGLHEATVWREQRLAPAGKMQWPDPPAFAPANGQEQAEAWERVIAHPALQPAHDVEGPLLDAVLQQLDRLEKLDDLEQDVRQEQAAETARAVLEYLQPVLPEQWARDAGNAFGVRDLYVADPTEQVPPKDLFRTRPESDGIGR